MTITVATKSVDDTRELGAALAAVVEPGDTILLAGDLGAGKTAFTQGFGRALGVEDRITSPTFTIMSSYRGRDLTLLHVDVYRMDRLQDVVDLGLGELIEEGAVAVVEWGDMAAPALPPDYLEIGITFGDTQGDGDASDEERTFVLRPVGQRWMARSEALRQAIARWAA